LPNHVVHGLPSSILLVIEPEMLLKLQHLDVGILFNPYQKGSFAQKIPQIKKVRGGST